MIQKIVSWINRTITHNRDDEGDYGIRYIIHIPAGILIGLFLLNKDLFIKYERNEDAHTQDEAWKDIAGAMAGCVIGRLILAGVIIYLIMEMLT